MADKLSDKEIERRKKQAEQNAAPPKPHENLAQACWVRDQQVGHDAGVERAWTNRDDVGGANGFQRCW